MREVNSITLSDAELQLIERALTAFKKSLRFDGQLKPAIKEGSIKAVENLEVKILELREHA